MSNTPVAQLMGRFSQGGQVRWIGLRPGRKAAMISVDSVEADIAQGLIGDRFQGRAGSKRQVTLIQIEHLTAIASVLGIEKTELQWLRRNIAVSGINLLALKGKQFQIGSAILEYTGLCHPCSRMEEILGVGGYNAVRGHGGITARVVESGKIAISDSVLAV